MRRLGRVLSPTKKLFDGKPNVASNLAQEGGRDVAATVKGNRGAAAISMPVLLVRAALPNFAET